MFQLPVNNLTRIRKARKKVKMLLSDIGLDYCKEHVEDYKEFEPDHFYMKNNNWEGLCLWDPTWTKSQDYRTKQFCCSECPFASKYFSAYKNHFRNVHRQDFEGRILLNCSYCTYSGNKRTLETHTRLFHMLPQSLARQQGLASPQGAFGGLKDGVRLAGAERKEQPVYYCKKCTYRDRLYNVVRRHIYREHFQHVAMPYVAKNSAKSLNSEAAPPVNSYGIHCKSCLFVPRTYEALVQHVIEFHLHIGYQVTAMIGHTNIVVSRSPTLSAAQRSAMMAAGVRHQATPQISGLTSALMGEHLKQGGSVLKGVTAQGQRVRITLPDRALGSGTLAQTHAAKQRLFSGKSDVLSFAGRVRVTSHLGVQSGLSASPSSSLLKSLPLSSSVQAATATVTSNSVKKLSTKPLNTAQTQKWKICTICNELFPESTYSAHFAKEHSAEKVQAMAKYIVKIHNFTSKCLYCNRYLPSDTLLSHMLVHGLSCPHCFCTFHDLEKIVAHKRQTHPNELADPVTGHPLTFDLTLQQGTPKNVQLIVTTYKDVTAAKSAPEVPTALARNSLSARAKKMCLKVPEGQSQGEVVVRAAAPLPQQKEVGKTLCPLCFTILKGPISDALALHLRERHQVLQTLHPVEKKLTYKCIHCLGVYTSNMSASTITLHLVHCRGAGQAPRGQDSKPIAALRSASAGSLKRELAAPDVSDPKRRKMVDQSRYYPTVFVERPEEPVMLALDPKGHADGTYEARKAFLTAYFNRHPYPSQREVEKLAASLWLWKSDVSSHFANRRRSCERDFVTRKPVVLLGFNMRAVNRLKHNMNFDPQWFFENRDEVKSPRTSKGRLRDSAGFGCKEGARAVQQGGLRKTPNVGQSSQTNTSFTLYPGSFLEPIAIDSDSGSDVEEISSESKKEPAVLDVQAQKRESVQEDASFSAVVLSEGEEQESSRHSARGEAKSLDGSLSGSSPEEPWSGSVSPDESQYRPAGLFQGQGKEVGLVGR